MELYWNLMVNEINDLVNFLSPMKDSELTHLLDLH